MLAYKLYQLLHYRLLNFVFVQLNQLVDEVFEQLRKARDGTKTQVHQVVVAIFLIFRYFHANYKDIK